MQVSLLASTQKCSGARGEACVGPCGGETGIGTQQPRQAQFQGRAPAGGLLVTWLRKHGGLPASAGGHEHRYRRSHGRQFSPQILQLLRRRGVGAGWVGWGGMDSGFLRLRSEEDSGLKENTAPPALHIWKKPSMSNTSAWMLPMQIRRPGFDHSFRYPMSAQRPQRRARHQLHERLLSLLFYAPHQRQGIYAGHRRRAQDCGSWIRLRFCSVDHDAGAQRLGGWTTADWVRR